MKERGETSRAVFETLEPRLLLSTSWQSMGEVQAAVPYASGYFGSAVSVSGDWAIVGSSGAGGSGTAYMYQRQGNAWVQESINFSPDFPYGGDGLGISVSVCGDWAIVGAPYKTTAAGPSAGAAYLFQRSGTTWSETQKLTASDATANDIYGVSVSINGDYAAVGAWGRTGNTGIAYVYHRTGGSWGEEKILAPSGLAAGGHFGVSVSLNGNSLLVGAPFDNAGSATGAGSAFLFTRSGADWTLEKKFTASDAAAYDRDGISVSINGDYAAIGAYGVDSATGIDFGAVYIYHRLAPSFWVQEKKIMASDGAASDQFGLAVSLSGDALAVGAPMVDGAASNSGAAYVFRRSGTDWTQMTKLTVADAAANDYLGRAVALSDGRLIVGISYDDDTLSNSGSVVFYQLTDAQKLAPSDPTANSQFGYAVAVSGDYAVVGAHYDDTNGDDAGAAYIFHRVGSAWVQETKLIGLDTGTSDDFGVGVAINGDYCVVGADYAWVGGARTGAAYVFHRTTGTTWVQEKKLLASDGAAIDWFGYSVSLSGDYCVVGSMGDDDAGSNSGSAYLFHRAGTEWTQLPKLVAPDAAAEDQFGTGVAVSGDYCVVGAYDDDTAAGLDAGSAYVFHRLYGTTWVYETKLLASDAGARDCFGYSVALDGDYCVVGAINDDTAAGADAGSAYAFHRLYGTVWTQEEKLVASDGAVNDRAGISVAISGDYAVVGAYGASPLGNGSGEAYVFHRTLADWTQTRKLVPYDGAANDSFGYSVGMSGAATIVGSYFANAGAAASGAAYVFETDPTLCNRPDLTGVVGWSTMTATVQAGDVFLYRVDVTNSGDALAMGLMKVQVWLSVDGDLTTGDDFLLSDSLVFAYIPRGASSSFYVVGIMPNGMPAGPHKLVAVIDSEHQLAETDCGELNNQWAQNAAATVTLPDLTCAFINVTFYSGGTTFLQGTSGYAFVQATNAGPGRTYGLGELQLWAIPVGPYPNRLLATATNQPFYLWPGTSGYYFIPFTLPADLMPVVYNLRLVVDSSNRFVEVNESNNTATTGSTFGVNAAYVQLLFAGQSGINPIIMNAPPTVTPTGSYNLVEVRVVNTGNVVASGVATITLWASLDGDLTQGGDDWSLAEIHPYVYILPGGGSTAYCYFSYLTPAIPSGLYDLIAVVTFTGPGGTGTNYDLFADRYQA